MICPSLHFLAISGPFFLFFLSFSLSSAFDLSREERGNLIREENHLLNPCYGV